MIERQLAHELRDECARMGSLFRSAGRGGEHAVDLLDEIRRRVLTVANRLDPPPRSPEAAPAPEGRFSTGTIAAKGRMVRVETRQRRRKVA